MTTLNIVNLIEKSAMTRLSGDYNNKLLIKIKENFNENQQQLFVASFYTFLNYDAKKDFVIDFDNVWKWLGFSRKDNAKRLLDKIFIEEIDYQLSKVAPDERGALLEPVNGGQNKETIMLTVNTFKKFCLKAGTKKADEIHDYYVKLEELLHETINEETNELKQQLLIKDKDLIHLHEKHFKLEENHKRILYKKKRHTLKKGPCLYLVIKEDDVKFGVTKNLNSRRSGYVTYFEPDFKFIMYANDNLLLEKCVKKKYTKNITYTDLGTEWIIDIDLEQIISFIEELALFLSIECTIYKNVEDVYDDDVKLDEDDNSLGDDEEDLEEEDVDNEECEGEGEGEGEDEEDDDKELIMKTCSKCLIEKEISIGFSKDKCKKDGHHTTCKVCEKEAKLLYKAKKEEEFVPLKDKQCAICKEVKDIVNFSKHLYTRDGYVNSCLQCSRQITNKARLENKNVRYKCCNCDKDYARKDSLTKHQKNCV